MKLIWTILRSMAPWHFLVAGVMAWSAFVGVKGYRAGGEARQAKIERAADANVKKAEKARAHQRSVDSNRPAGVRDPAARD